MTQTYYTSEMVNNGVVFRLTEYVDTINFTDVIEDLCKQVATERSERFLLDMKNVDFLHSASLGKLVKLHQRVKESRGLLWLCHVAPSCRTVLSVTQLDRVLQVYDDEESVLAVWANESPSHGKPPALAEMDRRVSEFNEEVVQQGLFVAAEGATREDQPWGRFEWFVDPTNNPSGRVRIGRLFVEGGQSRPFGRFPESEAFLMVESGRAELWIERTKHDVSPGQMAIVPQDTVHAIFNTGDDEFSGTLVLAPGATSGPLLVDVSQEEPWRSMVHGRELRYFELDHHGETVVARVSTDAISDQYNIEQFRNGLVQIAQKEHPQRLIVDLGRVKYLSSGALGALAKTREALKSCNGTLGVCGAQADVAKVLEITQFSRVVSVYPDRAAALADA